MSTRTDLTLVNSGQWIRAARRRYWHISGAEVSYDHNAWAWRTSVSKHLWSTLLDAAYEVERRTGA